LIEPIKVEPLLGEPSKEKVSLRDFIFVKNIGVGGFSMVYLVKKRSNGKFYAMKLIEKSFISTHDKQSIVHNERLIMA
jgi:serine/threonine protein kinase